MAYDVYPRVAPAPGFSWGVAGTLPRATTLGALAARMGRLAKGGEPVAFVGDRRRRVARVAVLAGAGGMAVERWRGQADALVTGELGHHAAREAEARGMAVVVAGHHATERPVVAFLAKRLRRERAIEENGVEVLALEDAGPPLRRAGSR
jgi:putative NIF3 family GTP cyclohydrolase 1 type 2